MRLSELGEFGLIDLLTRDFVMARELWRVGDDTAVLDMGGENGFCLPDMMVEEVHFP